jgi:WD40 repeat protein
VRSFDEYGTAKFAFQPRTYTLGIVNNKRAVILDPLRGRELFSLPLPVKSRFIIGRACAWSRDGRLFAASLNNGLIVMDVRDRVALVSKAMPSPISDIGALAFTPDGRELIMGGQHSAVYVLDLRREIVVRTLGAVRSTAGIDVLPDDSTLAICDFLDGVRLWNLRSGQLVDSLPGWESYRGRLKVSGEFLLAGCGGHAVDVWDSRTRSPLGSIDGHEYIAQQFSASAHAGTFLAGSVPGSASNPEGLSDSEILLIDISSRRTLASWRAHSADGIYETAVSEDGRRLATGGYDGQLNFWAWY